MTVSVASFRKPSRASDPCHQGILSRTRLATYTSGAGARSLTVTLTTGCGEGREHGTGQRVGVGACPFVAVSLSTFLANGRARVPAPAAPCTRGSTDATQVPPHPPDSKRTSRGADGSRGLQRAALGPVRPVTVWSLHRRVAGHITGHKDVGEQAPQLGGLHAVPVVQQ
jgi:hypothetical protein